MNPAWRHPWDVTPSQAREIQNEARRRVILTDDPAVFCGVGELPPRLLAADVGYDQATNLCLAALVEWDTAAGREIQHWTRVAPSTFPYVPGLLSFREIPALLPLFEALPFTPALVLCDGQGIAHPRRIGLASHLGVILDCPTLGWAKTLLTGRYAEPPPEGGAATPLLAPAQADGDLAAPLPRPAGGKQEQIGWAFRSRGGVKPTFVSPGHRVSLDGALALARALRGRYRLCDPARRAHELTRELLQELR